MTEASGSNVGLKRHGKWKTRFSLISLLAVMTFYSVLRTSYLHRCPTDRGVRRSFTDVYGGMFLLAARILFLHGGIKILQSKRSMDGIKQWHWGIERKLYDGWKYRAREIFISNGCNTCSFENYVWLINRVARVFTVNISFQVKYYCNSSSIRVVNNYTKSDNKMNKRQIEIIKLLLQVSINIQNIVNYINSLYYRQFNTDSILIYIIPSKWTIN